MPNVEVAVAGKLDIGKEGDHQIKSPFETQEEIVEYADKVRDKMVKADQPRCAVCMDGRGCRCLASDITVDAESSVATIPEYKKPPIRPKMAGGLYDMATMMAVLGGWSGLSPDTKDFNDARAQVAAFLTQEDYEDGAHTSDNAFENPDNTECGAWMKKKVAMEKGAATSTESLETQKPSALDFAVGAYNGVDAGILVQSTAVAGSSPEAKRTESVRQASQAVRHRQQQLVQTGFWDSFSATATRDEMKRVKPTQLEVLYSDPNHPTHNHKEPILAIVDTDDPTDTIDRDALYQEDGFAPFVDNRNLRRQIANLMGGTDEEKLRLTIAGDVTTVDVSDELIAPGMPVILIK